jgi:hypothetical protein
MATEAEDRREPTQHGVLSSLAGEDLILYCDGWHVPPAMTYSTTEKKRVEEKWEECICPRGWSVHHSFARDGR